jgi:hypothetical protein
MTAKTLLTVAAVSILAMLTIPAPLDGKHLVPASNAWASNAWAGNGHGNGAGNGNGGGNRSAGANSNAGGKAHPANHGAVASALGGLNAAHASPAALLNASPTSRVGKIAAYADANAAVQAVANQLAVDHAALDTATLANDTTAITADQALVDALNAAANKTPVSQATQDALDGLLAGN